MDIDQVYGIFLADRKVNGCTSIVKLEKYQDLVFKNSSIQN